MAFIVQGVSAQKLGQQRIDSLLAQMPALKEDTNMVKLLGDLSYTYYRLDADKGLAWGEKALALATKLGFKKGEARAYSSLGSNYYKKHNYIMAQEEHLKALTIDQALGDKREMARSIHNIGANYEMEHNVGKAIGYYKQALALLEEIKDTEAIIGYSTDIAYALEGNRNYPEALAYMQKCLQLSQQIHDPQNIATYFAGIGFVQCSLKNYALAIDNNERALKMFHELGDNDPWKDDIPSSLRTIAKAHFGQGNYLQAIKYYRLSYKGYQSLPGTEALESAANCLAGIGKCYLRMGISLPKNLDLDSNIEQISSNGHPLFIRNAVDTLEMAAQMAKSIADWESAVEILPILSKVQQLAGNPNAALNSYKQYSKYKDSVYNNDMEKKVALTQIEYEYNQQKDLLSNQNKLQAMQLLHEKELNKLHTKQQWLIIQ